MKLKLNDLKLQSFVTELDGQKVVAGKLPLKTHRAIVYSLPFQGC